MEKFPQNQVPFKDDLAKSRISEHQHGEIERLYEFKDDPNKIIRTMTLDDLGYEHHDLEDPIKLVALGKKLYQELEEKYNINAPVEYVVGKNKAGERVVYGITDRITSTVRDNEITPQLAEQAENLYVSLSKYYLDKSNKLPDGEMFLTDIRGFSQYVYGTRMNDEQSKLYLVDTDLYMHNDKTSFYYVVAWLIRHMSSVEEKTGKRFDVARDNIEKILENPHLEGLAENEKETIHKTISEAHNFLRGEFSQESDNLPSGNFRID